MGFVILTAVILTGPAVALVAAHLAGRELLVDAVWRWAIRWVYPGVLTVFALLFATSFLDGVDADAGPALFVCYQTALVVLIGAALTRFTYLALCPSIVPAEQAALTHKVMKWISGLVASIGRGAAWVAAIFAGAMILGLVLNKLVPPNPQIEVLHPVEGALAAVISAYAAYLVWREPEYLKVD